MRPFWIFYVFFGWFVFLFCYFMSFFGHFVSLWLFLSFFGRFVSLFGYFMSFLVSLCLFEFFLIFFWSVCVSFWSFCVFFAQTRLSNVANGRDIEIMQLWCSLFILMLALYFWLLHLHFKNHTHGVHL